ncbi:cyclase family protein [Bradyrhizobium lablabi]|uniref:cyclase family protein n=1 Tax=Bradyrhizobium lablabi TaxID=722472 RepID=UPI001BAC76F3|nr:cyclase family protein [Bradyrhizobium lablabi]MBR1125152.1 cyclase family protein [Bradyrhizobium lablabi]
MDSRLPGFDPALLAAIRPDARIYELSHAMAPSMPVYHQHIPFSLALHRRHGDPHPKPREDGSSFANEVIVTSGHSGTHIDALGHFSRNGCLHGGIKVSEVETRDGYREHNAADIPPILQHAVILDVAAAQGVECLKPAEEISVGDLERALAFSNAELRPGDAVLIRTGWSKYWTDAETFIGRRGGMPGPGEEAARWLVARGATLVGSDTPGFECLPTPGVSVHAIMLVDHGIHIMENLNLEEIAPQRFPRAMFIALPLRLSGSTGSPIRPVAIA